MKYLAISYLLNKRILEQVTVLEVFMIRHLFVCKREDTGGLLVPVSNKKACGRRFGSSLCGALLINDSLIKHTTELDVGYPTFEL